MTAAELTKLEELEKTAGRLQTRLRNCDAGGCCDCRETLDLLAALRAALSAPLEDRRRFTTELETVRADFKRENAELSAEILRLRSALEVVLSNEIGPGAHGAGHFEGCRSQWSRVCDCGIDVARAALSPQGVTK